MSPSRTLGVVAAMAVLTLRPGVLHARSTATGRHRDAYREPQPRAASGRATGSSASARCSRRPVPPRSWPPRRPPASSSLCGRSTRQAGVLGAPIEVFHRNSGEASGDRTGEILRRVARQEGGCRDRAVLVRARRAVAAEIRSRGRAADLPGRHRPGLSSAAASGWFFRTVPSAALQGSALAGRSSGKTASAKGRARLLR